MTEVTNKQLWKMWKIPLILTLLQTMIVIVTLIIFHGLFVDPVVVQLIFIGIDFVLIIVALTIAQKYHDENFGGKQMTEKELMEKYLKQRGFRKGKGFAINTKEMNPEEFEEIFFEGDSLEKAIEDYYREVQEYWIYDPSDGVQIFEEIEEAVEYAEETSDVDFKKFKEMEK